MYHKFKYDLAGHTFCYLEIHKIVELIALMRVVVSHHQKCGSNPVNNISFKFNQDNVIYSISIGILDK